MSGSGEVSGTSGVTPTTEAIRKYLDENETLISTIVENQNLGRHHDCAHYLNRLQQNLIYLATIADCYTPGATGPSRSASSDPPRSTPSGESGAWTAEEHRRFMEAIERWGVRDLRPIVQHVTTRTLPHVRQHMAEFVAWLAMEDREKLRSVLNIGPRAVGVPQEALFDPGPFIRDPSTV